MTEAEHHAFLETAEYLTWSQLHQRVALGEQLSPSEEILYQAIKQRLDAEERDRFIVAFQPSANELKQCIAALEMQINTLREKTAERSAYIQELHNSLLIVCSIHR